MSTNNNGGQNNMQIFTIIGQIEDIVENSPKPKLGGGPNKRVIDADEILDLLGDLKVTIPEDIRRANNVLVESQTMVDNATEHSHELVDEAQKKSDGLIEQANATAAQIIEKAKSEYERLVSEDEIYQEAQKRAKLLAMKAEYNSKLVYENARVYAEEVLKNLEDFLSEYKQLVSVNRNDLAAQAMKIEPTLGTDGAAQNAKPQAQHQAPAQKPHQPIVRSDSVQPVDPDADDVNPEDDFDYDEENDDKPHGSFFDLFKHKKKKDVDYDENDSDDDDIDPDM